MDPDIEAEWAELMAESRQLHDEFIAKNKAYMNAYHARRFTQLLREEAIALRKEMGIDDHDEGGDATGAD